MESQKTQNFPILRKKNKTVGIILSDFTFYLLQSYSNWNSIGTKIDIEINGTGEKTWREIHMLIVNLWERRQRLYNGEKTVSSISGAGKTGKASIKE